MTTTFNITPNIYYVFASNPMPPPIWPTAGFITFVLVVMFAIFIKVLMTYPKHNEVEITQKGIRCIENKEYKDAIKYFDEAIKININYTDAYFNKARALIKINETNEAITMLKEFIETTDNIADIAVAKEIINNLNINDGEKSNNIGYKSRDKGINIINVMRVLIFLLVSSMLSFLIINFLFFRH